MVSGKTKQPPKPVQWRLECLGHSLIEGLAGCLPGPWAFRLGEGLGGLVWRFMPLRRKMILRNLRIAFAGEKGIDELREMEKATFRRTAGNMVSAAHTARLSPAQLGDVIRVENIELLQDAHASGKGVVILLSHMGNWEVLSRLIHFFPKGSKAGAFYRPLNNLLLDERVLARRQADGTRMFSKRDNPLHVAAFLRDGGIVGILADQRVGTLGEVVNFFGRLTRASPLPSLLARRSKSVVLALSVVTEAPGKWKAVFRSVASPHTTANCMLALEQSMKSSPVDVFWFQERWKVYVRPQHSIREWLGDSHEGGGKQHRALLWLTESNPTWQVPAEWIHPDVVYEVALTKGAVKPSSLPDSTIVHMVDSTIDSNALQQAIATIDAAAALPIDFILAPKACKDLIKAGRREAVPVVSLP